MKNLEEIPKNTYRVIIKAAWLLFNRIEKLLSHRVW